MKILDVNLNTDLLRAGQVAVQDLQLSCGDGQARRITIIPAQPGSTALHCPCALRGSKECVFVLVLYSGRWIPDRLRPQVVQS